MSEWVNAVVLFVQFCMVVDVLKTLGCSTFTNKSRHPTELYIFSSSSGVKPRCVLSPREELQSRPPPPPASRWASCVSPCRFAGLQLSAHLLRLPFGFQRSLLILIRWELGAVPQSFGWLWIDWSLNWSSLFLERFDLCKEIDIMQLWLRPRTWIELGRKICLLSEKLYILEKH